MEITTTCACVYMFNKYKRIDNTDCVCFPFHAICSTRLEKRHTHTQPASQKDAAFKSYEECAQQVFVNGLGISGGSSSSKLGDDEPSANDGELCVSSTGACRLISMLARCQLEQGEQLCALLVQRLAAAVLERVAAGAHASAVACLVADHGTGNVGQMGQESGRLCDRG